MLNRIYFGVIFGGETDLAKDTLVIQGEILDSSRNALSEANVLPFLNGKPFLASGHGAEAEKGYLTGKNGLFRIEILLAEDKIKSGKWEIKVSRPSFKPSQLTSLKILDDGVSDDGVHRWSANTTIQLGENAGGCILGSLGRISRRICAHSVRDPP